MSRFLLIIPFLFSASICLAQENVAGLLEKAIELQKNDDLLTSILFCDKALDLDNTLTSAHFLRGYNNFLLKKYREAINDFSAAINLNPEYLDAYFYRAKSRQAVGDYTGALKDLNHSREINPIQTTFMIARGLFSSIFGGSAKKSD
jgi:tetratricopeptide (TPR) repeat protein